MNPIFYNWTVTITKKTIIKDGTGFYEDDAIVYSDIQCQICCSDGSVSVSGCSPVLSQQKQLSVRIDSIYTLVSNWKRTDFTISVTDILWDVGNFRVEDIKPLVLPKSGLYWFELITQRKDG